MHDAIRKAKEQGINRRYILDWMEKWKFAAKEEKWLDEYERVDTRYHSFISNYFILKEAIK
jgi:protein regulator of cytokinesis 1